MCELCREIGGSEEDVQRARATIIDKNYNFDIKDNDTFEPKMNQADLDINRYSSLIFVPEEILDFLIEEREIRNQYSKAIDEEERRIWMQRTNSSPDKNNTHNPFVFL